MSDRPVPSAGTDEGYAVYVRQEFEAIERANRELLTEIRAAEDLLDRIEMNNVGVLGIVGLTYDQFSRAREAWKRIREWGTVDDGPGDDPEILDEESSARPADLPSVPAAKTILSTAGHDAGLDTACSACGSAAVHWNEFNEVTQCHRCGHVATPDVVADDAEYRDRIREAVMDRALVRAPDALPKGVDEHVLTVGTIRFLVNLTIDAIVDDEGWRNFWGPDRAPDSASVVGRSEQDRRIGNLEGALALTVNMLHARMHDSLLSTCDEQPCRGGRELLAGTGLLPTSDNPSSEGVDRG